MSAKDSRALIKLARKAGALVSIGGSGHWRITNPATGLSVTMSVSPSCHHALAKQRKDLRRIGFNV